MTAAASSAVSDSAAVDELRAAWAEISRGYARFWAAMTAVAERTSSEWESAEIAAALTFTTRRTDYELGCAQMVVDDLPWVQAALATGELDHHKARVFADYLTNVTAAQAERICERLVPVAPGWTTGQLAARLLREVQAIDPDYTRQAYERAVRERGVHGYLDHHGTAVLTGSGLPAADAAAAAQRLEQLAGAARAAGYPATVNQTRADLYVRLLDGTFDGQNREQILATMLRLGPLSPSDDDRTAECEPAEPKQPPAKPGAPEQPASEPSAQRQPEHAEPTPSDESGADRPVRYGIEVRLRLSTLLGLDEHPAELPGWGPIPAPTARDLVAVQYGAEWRVAIVDTDGYLLHGDLTRRRPTHHARGSRDGRHGGIVEIAVPDSMLARLDDLACEHPNWARLLHGIHGIWQHRDQARAGLDQHPNRRFAHTALHRHVEMRDRSCVGVGCRRRAAAADLDHTRNHAHGGRTVTTNSGPLCTRDHARKHQGGWSFPPRLQRE